MFLCITQEYITTINKDIIKQYFFVKFRDLPYCAVHNSCNSEGTEGLDRLRFRQKKKDLPKKH